MAIEQIIARYERAKTRRTTWETTWQECYDYTMPNRDGITDFSPGQRRDDLIFDETAVVGVQEFASRMLSGIVPNNMRWARFEPSPTIARHTDPSDLANLQGQLDEVNQEVFEHIEQSNFQQECYESFLDVSVGTGNLVEEEGDAIQTLRFSSVGLHEMFIEEGPFGFPSGWFRKRKLKAEDIKTIWPRATETKTIRDKKTAPITQNDDGKIDVLIATVRDWADPETEVYHHYICDLEAKESIYEEEYRGIGSNPWITFRWSKAPGEVYGRGPVFNALAAIKTCNLTVQLILENAEMSIAGMWQSDDDGVINPDNVRLVPGAVIPRTTDSTGLEPLSAPGNFNVADLVLKDMRHNINRALYNETLGRREGTPVSATEVAERMAELSRQVGSAHGRLQQELVFPVMRRSVFLLKQQGRIEMPTLNGKEIKIVPVSPLVRAQNNEDISQHVNYAQVLGQLFGPAAVQQMINPQKFAEKLAHWYEIDRDLLTTEEEQRNNAQNLTEVAGAANEAGVNPTEMLRAVLP